MQSHCQHNLYICHCSPSSQDPSPIHPPLPPKPTKSSMKQKSNNHNTMPHPRNNKKAFAISPTHRQVAALQYYDDQSLIVQQNGSQQPVHIIHQQTLPRMLEGRHSIDVNTFQQPQQPVMHLKQQNNISDITSPLLDLKENTQQLAVAPETKEASSCNISSDRTSPSTASSSSSVSAPTQIIATLPRTLVSKQQPSNGHNHSSNHSGNGHNHSVEGTVNPLSLIADPASLDICCNTIASSNSVTSVPLIATTGTGVTITSSLSSHGGLSAATTVPTIRDLDRMNQHYDQIIQQQAIISQRNHPKFFGCNAFQGRTCVERVIFGFLILLIVSVFLIGGIIFVQVLSGAPGTGLRSFSAMIFAGNSDGGDGSSNRPSQGHLRPDNDIGRLLSDEDIEIVRIKTTEEVSTTLFLLR